LLNRYLPTTPLATALAIFALAFATIAGAWIFEALGYLPCDLCYLQRDPYYFGMPVALLTALAAKQFASQGVARGGLMLLAAIFAIGVGLAVYHSGVETKLWQGPTACTGTAINGPANAGDLLAQLDTVKVVRCDAVSLRVFGLSLANWNIFISAAFVCLAVRAAFRHSEA